MAGDWIKMRCNLVTHPRVMLMAEILAGQRAYRDWSTLTAVAPIDSSIDDERNERHAALRVTRYVTVCALLQFWSYANEHARNEVIEFASLDSIDEITQVPGFGRALQAVGWVEPRDDSTGLFLPNFNEFNAVASERSSGAARQKRYRERKKQQLRDAKCDTQSDTSRDVTSDVTVTPREEKRREDVNTIGIPSAGGIPPTHAEAEPTSAGALSRALRSAGVSCGPAHPAIIELVEQGVATETVLAAALEARKAKPTEAIGIGYVLGILKRWAETARRMDVTGAQMPSRGPSARDQSRAAAAASIGLGAASYEPEPAFIDGECRVIG